ncbi:MAG: class I SAM-dependent methyltransferase [Bdellovibrionales bacterium]|nr:class I SAM-dependent methyltransferase [Bdellovibrionales bacterium]
MSIEFLRPTETSAVRQHVDRRSFLDHFPKEGVGAEIGVFRGEFAQALLEKTHPKMLYLIDKWWHIAHEPKVQPSEWRKTESSQIIDDFVSVVRVFQNELIGGTVDILVGDDLKILSNMPTDSLDWAYLDTTHQYEQTKLELSILSRIVKPDGIIAGHDWQPDPSHRHHGVAKAVRELVDSGQYQLWYLDNHLQWGIRKDGE